MTLVNLFFSAHQPERLKPQAERPPVRSASAESLAAALFDEALNYEQFQNAAHKRYVPAISVLLDLAKKYKLSPHPFRCALSLSGTLLMQCEQFMPELIELLRELSDTGCVEFIAETYYHSLSSLFSGCKSEFHKQVEIHSATIDRLFEMKPILFRNTECLFSNSLAEEALQMGFQGIITEGFDTLLEDSRSPDFVYSASNGLPVLLRNSKLSDELCASFATKDWLGWPLTPDTFVECLAQVDDMGVTIGMDFEAIGEDLWSDTGIADFLDALIATMAQHFHI